MSLERSFIDHLKAIAPQPFRLVDGAAEFASIDQAPKAFPAAYVIIEEEASAENARAMGGPVLQRCEADVAVIIITRNVSDAKGAAASVDLAALKQQVRDALLGKVPAGSEDGTPIEHVSGNLLRARGGWVWWREVFSAAYYVGEPE